MTTIHLLFGVNLRSGGGRWWDKKGRGTAWSQIISLLVWAQEIMEYSQAIVNCLFRKVQVAQ